MSKFRQIFCILFGHGHVYESFMGEHSCARCGSHRGDSLVGAFHDDLAVLVGHNCQTCFDNYGKLRWIDKLFIPFPFEKEKDGTFHVITPEERQKKRDEALADMDRYLEIRRKRDVEMETIWEDLSPDVLGWVQAQPEDTINRLLREGANQEKPLKQFFTEAAASVLPGT